MAAVAILTGLFIFRMDLRKLVRELAPSGDGRGVHGLRRFCMVIIVQYAEVRTGTQLFLRNSGLTIIVVHILREVPTPIVVLARFTAISIGGETNCGFDDDSA